MTISRYFRYLMKGDERERFLETYRVLADHVIASEPGTLLFLVHRDKEDPKHVMVYAAFRDEDALARHKQSDVYKAVHDAVAPMLARTEEIRTVVMKAKGLERGNARQESEV